MVAVHLLFTLLIPFSVGHSATYHGIDPWTPRLVRVGADFSSSIKFLVYSLSVALSNGSPAN